MSSFHARVKSPILRAVGGLSRFFGSRDDVPEWARFFDARAYRAFLEAVGADLKRRGLMYEIDDGVVEIRRLGVAPRKLGLLNLAQSCNLSDRAEWPGVVAAHFDLIVDADADAAFDDFASVRSLVKLRLYPPDYAEQGVDLVASRPIPETIAAVVLDLPQTIRTVTADNLAAWGRSCEEILDLALSNVRDAEPPARQELPMEEGGTLTAYLGDDFYVATRALLLPEAGRFGSLVAVPHRHALIVHEISDRHVIHALQRMAVIAFGMFQEGPGSITPNVYWRRDGTFTLIPTKVTATSLTVTPPDAFVIGVLNLLAAE